MIPYFDELMPEEKEEITSIIQILQKQTFILERKYDKKTGRFQYNKDYRVCSNHFEFLKEYFAISGVELEENSQSGIIYICTNGQTGEKLSKLATLYLLILKVIYDEQMASASNSVNIITTLADLHDRLGNSLGLMNRIPSQTDIKKAIAVLKKYQVIEPLDMMEVIEPDSRFLIYPAINVVLFGEDVRQLLKTFEEGGDSYGKE